MEKKERNGFIYLKPETDDDFDYIVKTNGLCFFKDEDGNLYCEDFIKMLFVVYIKKEKRWEVCSKEEVESIDFTKVQDVDFASTWKELEAQNLLPLKALEEARGESNNEYKEYWDYKTNNTVRKVIGWAKMDTIPFIPIEAQDAGDQYFAALVNDIRKHCYFFAGDEIQSFPIFNDYTTLRLSSRLMGQAMALASGSKDSMDYAIYAWAGRLYEEFDPDDKVLPMLKPYQKASILEVNADNFQFLKDNIMNFWNSENSKNGYVNSMIIIPLKLDEKHYWDRYGLEIKNTSTGEVIKWKTFDIRTVYYKQELDEYLDEQLQYLSSDDDKYLYVDNYKSALELVNKHPTVLLVFKSL